MSMLISLIEDVETVVNLGTSLNQKYQVMVALPWDAAFAVAPLGVSSKYSSDSYAAVNICCIWRENT